jgi:hypothetical protein
MEQSPPREGTTHPDTQEIPHRLWKPKVHFCVRKADIWETRVL